MFVSKCKGFRFEWHAVRTVMNALAFSAIVSIEKHTLLHSNTSLHFMVIIYATALQDGGLIAPSIII
jgi:hypothetical protein